TSSTTATTTTSTTQPSSTKETVPETKPGDVIEISKISLDKAAITVNEGQKINIVASIWPGYTTEKTVTWSVNNSRVGVCSQTKNTSIGLYDDEGKLYCTETATFTAKASGQTIIKAVSNTGLVAKCVVNVKPVAKTLTVSKTSVTLNVGKSTTVKATVGPASISSTYKKVAWTTSNKKVATVTSAGKIVARGKGVCTVYATSSDNTTLKKAIKVTVKQPVTSVKFNKSSIKLAKKGASKTVKVTASPANANNKTLAIKSENTKIAKVSKSTVNSGAKIKVTAVKKGSTYVRATAKDGSKKYARIKVTVKK
ncbi:MAG: Ig domain-containing protein, partial [Ruminococcus sp.]